MNEYNYWGVLWRQFKKRKIGTLALVILIIFFLIGLYAPLLASSKPLLVMWEGKLYSPLFRYLFYQGFYSKPIDLFFNILMFTLPIALLGIWLIKKRKKIILWGMSILQCVLFGIILTGLIKNPESNLELKENRQQALVAKNAYREDPLLTPLPKQVSWEFDLKHMSEYEKLNKLLKYKQQKNQNSRLLPYLSAFQSASGTEAPTLWVVERRHLKNQKENLRKTLRETKSDYQESLDHLPDLIEAYRPYSHIYIMEKYNLEHASEESRGVAAEKLQQALNDSTKARLPLAGARRKIEAYHKAASSLAYLEDRENWLENESSHLQILIPSLLREFHWEEDAGGSQTLNTYLPFWELTRMNRKDLVASLLFGIRLSFVVGFTAVSLSLLIGIPLGMLAGYFAGKLDLVICRFIEIWEAMPTFFMLLLVVAITQSKSIFLVIAVLGIFGWTSFGRFIRAEALKQRNLPYVMAGRGIGYPHRRIMFSHILPNALPPILTLLPFSMMAAITSEAGISFLGLGEEGSTSWGVLMDEGRAAFPAESYLLWPPAILLTLLLVCIALVGDALRDALDPRMQSE